MIIYDSAFPEGTYRPNVMIRIGLFLLTCVITSFAAGLLSLIFSASDIIETPGWLIFLAVLSYAALEMVVRSRQHYQSGVDDALILTVVGLMIAALAMYSKDNYLVVSAVVTVACVLLCLRFANMLMAMGANIALLSFVFFFWLRLEEIGKLTLPFVMMVVSGCVYVFSYRLYAEIKKRYYEDSIKAVQLISLFTFYLSGNYYVVQQLNAVLNGGKLHALPLGAFFWIWTGLVPFIYIAFGLKMKNIILLRGGLILIAAAAFTFRNYYHIMPFEALLCLVGVLLIALAYGAIKYLNTPKHGFTYLEPDEGELMDKLKVESLIVSETAPQAPGGFTHDKPFGGGNFGGGGASSNF